jgi:histidine triad (HIT) family protein
VTVTSKVTVTCNKGEIILTCPFCPPKVFEQNIVFENSHALFLLGNDPILGGSGLIVPRAHRVTVFDLSREEWDATFALLQRVKPFLDQEYAPDGYNVGWNCGAVGGQEVFHAHLHVIPRFKDEPLAGKGIRYWFKQEANRRPLL